MRTHPVLLMAMIILLAGFPRDVEAVDLVRVDKSERLLELIEKGRVVRSYSVALGGNPVGQKQQEGDQRTLEGRYVLDGRIPDSCCHRLLHVSYPGDLDKARAAQRGVDPGGMIMIHGQVNGWGWLGWFMQWFDWTDGCMAVTNSEMDEIWALVRNGTPIEINP